MPRPFDFQILLADANHVGEELRQARRWRCSACEKCVVVDGDLAIRCRARHSRCEGIGGRTAEGCTPDLDAESVLAWITDDTLHVRVAEPLRLPGMRHWVLQSPTPTQAEALLAYALLYTEYRLDERQRFRLTLTWLGIRMPTSSYMGSRRNR